MLTGWSGEDLIFSNEQSLKINFLFFCLMTGLKPLFLSNIYSKVLWFTCGEIFLEIFNLETPMFVMLKVYEVSNLLYSFIELNWLSQSVTIQSQGQK